MDKVVVPPIGRFPFLLIKRIASLFSFSFLADRAVDTKCRLSIEVESMSITNFSVSNKVRFVKHLETI